MPGCQKLRPEVRPHWSGVMRQRCEQVALTYCTWRRSVRQMRLGFALKQMRVMFWDLRGYEIPFLLVFKTLGPRLTCSPPQSLCTFISAASKVAQLQCLWRSKDAGQVSAMTWAMASYSCLGEYAFCALGRSCD